jgi:hypothetical protein
MQTKRMERRRVRQVLRIYINVVVYNVYQLLLRIYLKLPCVNPQHSGHLINLYDLGRTISSSSRDTKINQTTRTGGYSGEMTVVGGDA